MSCKNVHDQEMNDALTVSQFVEAVNYALDALEYLTVEGEVSEYKVIHNKWVTFSLKDDKSSIGCFMTVWQLKTIIEDGMLVKVTGQPRLREKGFFSFVLQTVQPSGEGALRRAFQLLQQKLHSEGVFDPIRKRSLPRFPRHIAFITSRDAAAYNDFLKVLTARQGGLTISFIHTQVQGEDAPRQIIQALETANTELSSLDVIVLVRGGGSLEDLHAFNDEEVVRAVAASRTPTVVGIGHERDVTLAELAADVRASTPSNAAELVVRSRQEIELDLRHLQTSLKGSLEETMQQKQQLITRSVSVLKSRIQTTAGEVLRKVDSLKHVGNRLRQQISQNTVSISAAPVTLRQLFTTQTRHTKEQLNQLQRILQSLSPHTILKRGYSITRGKDGKVVTSVTQLAKNETVTTTLADGSVVSIVENISNT